MRTSSTPAEVQQSVIEDGLASSGEATIRLGDLNGDGLKEQIRSNPFNDFSCRLSVHSSSGELLWEASGGEPSAGVLFDLMWLVMDFDGDGKDEIVYSQANRGGPPVTYVTLDWDGSKLVEQVRGPHFQDAHKLELMRKSKTNEAFQPKTTTGAYLADIKGPSKIRGRFLSALHFSILESGVMLTRDAELEPTANGFKITRWLGEWSGPVMLPKSLIEPIKDGDLQGFSAKELTIIRNQIFAVHGRGFRDAELSAYFNSQAWYRPSRSYQDTHVSKTQNRNALYVSQYQNKNGLNW